MPGAVPARDEAVRLAELRDECPEHLPRDAERFLNVPPEVGVVRELLQPHVPVAAGFDAHAQRRPRPLSRQYGQLILGRAGDHALLIVLVHEALAGTQTRRASMRGPSRQLYTNETTSQLYNQAGTSLR